MLILAAVGALVRVWVPATDVSLAASAAVRAPAVKAAKFELVRFAFGRHAEDVLARGAATDVTGPRVDADLVPRRLTLGNR